jgi:hypothetical protein
MNRCFEGWTEALPLHFWPRCTAPAGHFQSGAHDCAPACRLPEPSPLQQLPRKCPFVECGLEGVAMPAFLFANLLEASRRRRTGLEIYTQVRGRGSLGREEERDQTNIRSFVCPAGHRMFISARTAEPPGECSSVDVTPSGRPCEFSQRVIQASVRGWAGFNGPRLHGLVSLGHTRLEDETSRGPLSYCHHF